MVEQMTLQELVTRRLRDYGYRGARDLADIIGVHVNHAERIMSGKQKNVGIETRRALVRALDLGPGVIERSVRRA